MGLIGSSASMPIVTKLHINKLLQPLSIFSSHFNLATWVLNYVAYKYQCGLLLLFIQEMAIIYVPARLSMLSIFILFFCTTPPLALSLVFENLQLPPGVSGPESYAFKAIRKPKFGFLGVLYTGVYDGRILTSQGGTANFTDFAFTAPNRLALYIRFSITSLKSKGCFINETKHNK